MKRDLPEGVIFNARTKNQHVSEIEAAIRVVKERVRGVKNILPYTLAPLLLIVMFGRKCNVETNLSLQFCQYVETRYDHQHSQVQDHSKHCAHARGQSSGILVVSSASGATRVC